MLLPFAVAGELGRGQPSGHVLRTCLIAMELAEELGLSPEQRSDVYYTSLLVHTGCTAGSAHFAAALACDELVAQKDCCLCDPDNFTEVLAWMRRNVSPQAPLPERLGRMLGLMLKGGEFTLEVDGGCSDVGGRIARRLGMSAETVKSLHNVCERWNGKGPHKLRGAAIPLPTRVVGAAAVAEIFSAEHGAGGARTAIEQRRGKSVDPEMARAFRALAGREELWQRLKRPELWPQVLELEPGSVRRHIDEAALDEVALALADFADLKSPRMAAHSRATSELAAAMAKRLGLSAAEIALVRRAGLVHDLGQVGVPVAVLERREALSPLDEARLSLHPELTERILAGSAAFREAAALAAMHHERLDGQGYPRRLPGAQLPMTARVLAVADWYLERRQPDAAAALRAERGRGLDGDCVDALLAETGTGKSKRPKGASELSEREIEVLRLAARELTIKEIAKLLFVSAHTVRHHLEHIHEKLGVSSRAGAVLYAMEQGLLEE